MRRGVALPGSLAHGKRTKQGQMGFRWTDRMETEEERGGTVEREKFKNKTKRKKVHLHTSRPVEATDGSPH